MLGQNYTNSLRCLKQGRKSAGNDTRALVVFNNTASAASPDSTSSLMVPGVSKQPQSHHSQLLRTERCVLLAGLLLYRGAGGIDVTLQAPEIHALHPSVHPKSWNLRFFLVFWPYTLQPYRNCRSTRHTYKQPSLLPAWRFINCKTCLLENLPSRSIWATFLSCVNPLFVPSFQYPLITS